MPKLSLAEQIDQMLFHKKIALERRPLQHIGLLGHYYHAPDMAQPVITIDNDVQDDRELNCVKIHEIGHHETLREHLFLSSQRVQERSEALAQRWSAKFFLHPDRLIAAHKRGSTTTPDELADDLEITVEELGQGLESMHQIYGDSIQHQGYTIYWQPFAITPSTKRRECASL